MRLYKLLMELHLGPSCRKLKEAEALDEAMKQLEDQVNQDDQISNSSPFINEDSDKQKNL